MAITTRQESDKNIAVVETWEDFKIVNSDDNLYNNYFIECKEPNLIWDMNIEEPEGVVGFEARRDFDGKGVKIINGYNLSEDKDSIIFTSSHTWSNVNLLNWYQATHYTTVYTNSGKSTLKNCKFSIVLTNGNALSNFDIYNSSFNIKILGDCRIGGKNNFTNCKIRLSGNATKSYANTGSATTFNNCDFVGHNPFRINNDKYNNCKIDCTYGWNDGWYNAGQKISHTIYNTDKYANISPYQNTDPSEWGAIGLTSAEMVNATKLQSVGFPAVDLRQ